MVATVGKMNNDFPRLVNLPRVPRALFEYSLQQTIVAFCSSIVERTRRRDTLSSVFLCFLRKKGVYMKELKIDSL